MANGRRQSKSTLTVVGLGPAGTEYLTAETIELLGGSAPVWLRTKRHPAASGLDIAGSFDSLYENHPSFDEVYAAIVSNLVNLARDEGHVVYAVPGSPAVAEHTVELLRTHPEVLSGDIWLDIRPAMAFTDLCWTALGIDPMAEAVTIVDALSLSVQSAGRIGPMLITQVHSMDVLDDVIAVLDDVSPAIVTILQGLGTTAELVSEVAWSELRRAVDPDHLTSLWIPRLEAPVAASLVQLDEMVRRLRDTSPEAIEYSLGSLRNTLPEASAGVVEAVERVIESDDDSFLALEDGLADLLFLLMLHIRLAAEAGFCTIEDVAETARRRHSA